MGAHTAMLVMMNRPDLVDRLVVSEGTPEGTPTGKPVSIGTYFRSWPGPVCQQQGTLARGTFTSSGWQVSNIIPDDCSPPFNADTMQAVLDGLVIDSTHSSPASITFFRPQPQVPATPCRTDDAGSHL